MYYFLVCLNVFSKLFYLENEIYCNHFGGFVRTLTVGDSNPSFGKIEPRPGRMIMPSVS